MTRQWQGCVGCRDWAGRERDAVIAIRGEELVLTTPPGGSLRLGPGDVDQAERLHAIISAWIAQTRAAERADLPPQDR